MPGMQEQSILVQYCRTDTTHLWLDTNRTTYSDRETMVYGPYKSWKNGDLHIISNIDPYDPYSSYGS